MSDTTDEPLTLSYGEPDRLVVSINKRSYATGLIWQSVPEGETVKTVLEAARNGSDRPDFYVVSPSGGQIGLGLKANGHKSGMPSLAASVAVKLRGGGQQGPAVGIFDVGGGTWWIVAVVEQTILAETDIPVLEGAGDSAGERLATVIAEFNATLGLRGDWDTIYCPADWGIPHSQDMAITALLPPASKSPRLKDFFPWRLVYTIAAGVVAAGLLFTAWELYEGHEQKLAEEAQALVTSERARQAAQIAQRNALQNVPWAHKPFFAPALTACVQQTETLPRAVPGWHLMVADCTGQSLSVTYGVNEIGGGSIAWVAAAFPGVSVNWTGKTASLTWNLTGIETQDYKNAKPYPNIAYMTDWVSSRLDETFQLYAVAPGKKPPVSSIRPRPGVLVPAFYPNVDLTIATNYPPSYLLPILSQVPTLTLSKLEYLAADKEWKITSTFYGPVPLTLRKK